MHGCKSLGLIAGLLLLGCGDDAPAEPSDESSGTAAASTSTATDPTAATSTGNADSSTTAAALLYEFELSDGTVLRVDQAETISLWSGERRVFALRGDPKPAG